MATDEREEQLAAQQDARLYPVGAALRATYDAENHDSLGRDVTALMLDLSRTPPEPMRPDLAGPPAQAASMQQSLINQMCGAIGRRFRRDPKETK